MPQEMILKTDHTPSYFNKDTLLGGMLGMVGGGIALAATNVIIPGGGLLLAAAGAAVGGYLGKKRQEHENAHGKKVGEPTLWNKDTAIGGLVGMAGAGLVALASGALAVAATVGTAAAAPGAAPVVGILGLAATVISAVGAPFIGAYIGGRIGKNRQTRELEEAKHQAIVENISRTVSPEVGQAVEYSLSHNKEWGKQVLEDKLRASTQQPEAGR